MILPIAQFNSWWSHATEKSQLNQKNAVCVSTIDSDGFPDNRFVDLKEVTDVGFVFCTFLDSQKGKHIRNNPNVAIAIWWDHVGYQIRIKGSAEEISNSKAQKYWESRSLEAQLTTSSFHQSEPMPSIEYLKTQIAINKRQMTGLSIPKPKNWGGYCVKPSTIEFLTFKESRLHIREYFSLDNKNNWRRSLLQP